MSVHKVQIVVPESRELMIKLPDDFPTGRAEVIVIAEGESEQERSGKEAAEHFEKMLRELLQRVPPVPVLPPEAFDRAGICGD